MDLTVTAEPIELTSDDGVTVRVGGTSTVLVDGEVVVVADVSIADVSGLSDALDGLDGRVSTLEDEPAEIIKGVLWCDACAIDGTATEVTLRVEGGSQTLTIPMAYVPAGSRIVFSEAIDGAVYYEVTESGPWTPIEVAYQQLFQPYIAQTLLIAGNGAGDPFSPVTNLESHKHDAANVFVADADFVGGEGPVNYSPDGPRLSRHLSAIDTALGEIDGGGGGGGGGGGPALSDATPQALGTATAGTSSDASRADHVHDMPSASDVGAATAGDISSAISTHAAASDPHGDRSFTTSAVSTHTAASDPHGDRSFTTSAISTHAAASDPHGDRSYAAGLVTNLVTGPASAVDGRVALFDGTTGKLVKQSAAALAAIATSGSASDLSTGTVPASVLPHVHVIKASNEVVNGSTTLQDDDELKFTAAASSTYLVEIGLVMTAASSNAPDAKLALTIPSGATMSVLAEGVQASETVTVAGNGSGPATREAGILASSGTSIVVGVVTGGAVFARLRGWVKTGVTSGAVTFQWAQNSSNASDSQVSAGSYLVAWKVA